MLEVCIVDACSLENKPLSWVFAHSLGDLELTVINTNNTLPGPRSIATTVLKED